MGALATGGIVALALAALWIAIGAGLAWFAAQRVRQAATVLSTARSLQSLLELSPARPLVVRPGGQVEADSRLLREIGLNSDPRTIAELAGDRCGLVAEDAETLARLIADAKVSGMQVQCQVRLTDSPRVFEIRGGPAPAPEPAGTLILWFSDTSASED